MSTIQLIRDEGEGEGEGHNAHRGTRVQHRSRVRKNHDQPNLRQGHLLPSELLAELMSQGYEVSAGVLGESITTAGIDLFSLATNAVLDIGTKT